MLIGKTTLSRINSRQSIFHKRQLGNIMDFLKDLWAFLRVRKKWWLAPIIIILLLVGILLVLGGGSAMAPFIYTLF